MSQKIELQEIRVRFSPSADDRYRVQFTDAAGNAQGVAGDFTPFLAEDDYENLRWYLEEYMDLPDGGAVVRAEGIERQLDQWGRRLHDALFAALVRTLGSQLCPAQHSLALSCVFYWMNYGQAN